MPTKFVLFFILTIFFITPACAQEKEDFSTLTMTGEAQVAQIIDPLRIRLQDGRIIQLTGLDIPDLTPYDSGDIGMAALNLLREKLTQKTIKTYQSKKADKGRVNRMGYQLAHIAEKNSGTWIQGLLLDEGLARVRPSTVNIEMAKEMMAREQSARDQKKGLWAMPDYAVLDPDTAQQALHGWAIIDGTVRATAMTKNNVFLNFGPNWRTDFTIGIPPAVRRKLTNMNIDPLQFANKHVRVRGWVEDYNGPYIELMDPVWIEILPDAAERSTLP